jgi:hypothetical protein
MRDIVRCCVAKWCEALSVCELEAQLRCIDAVASVVSPLSCVLRMDHRQFTRILELLDALRVYCTACTLA